MSDTCGCFDDGQVPERPGIRAGLTALTHRPGTHPEVLSRLLRRLGGEAPLAGLTTRETDDPSIALLDAYAVVADVLGFYQERIINEGYLATATERRSILELARMIGYELAPGVAAHVYLAFGVEDRGLVDDGNGIRCTIPAGTRVQSIPGQDELPQTFETSEELVAYAELNDLRAEAVTKAVPTTQTDEVWLAGTATRLAAGDVVVLAAGDADGVGVAKGAPSARRVKRVVVDGPTAATRVELVPESSGGILTGVGSVSGKAKTYTATGTVGKLLEHGSVSSQGADAYAASAGISIGAMSSHFASVLFGWVEPAPNAPGLYAMRRSTGVFGHNSPPAVVDGNELGMPDTTKIGTGGIELDSVVRAAAPGSYVVIEQGNTRTVARVDEAEELSRAQWGISAKVTKITLSGHASGGSAPDVSGYLRRKTTVFAEAERLPFAERPDTTALAGTRIRLEAPPRFFLGAGRQVIVSGEDHAEAGVHWTERRTIARVDHTTSHTTITLDRGLTHSYTRASVRVAANVVHATHGETVTEVLGSGDGSAHQRFVLRRPPLTHVSAPTASGAESTLEVRVDGVRWEHAERLFGSEPTAERYEIQRTDEGSTHVTFGDGRCGARIPSGAENVTARYRTGIGAGGMVGPRRLTLLQTRPLGIRDVVNPLPAEGAGEPEGRDAARSAAPLTVRTLDRVVTVQDYEDFAGSFAGVGKARAALIGASERPVVHLSVATPAHEPLTADSDTYRNLLAALEAAGDPGVRVAIAGFAPVLFGLDAAVVLDGRRVAATVLADVAQALAARFSFERREFGQGVSVSELTAVVLAVPGTVSVRVTALGEISRDNDRPTVVTDPLLVHVARPGPDGSVEPAQLLFLARGGARLTKAPA